MRHHQPSAAEVQARERARTGEAGQKRRQAEQQEIDKLYRDVIQGSETSPQQRP